MQRSLTTAFAVLLILVIFGPDILSAQNWDWNSPRVMELARRATERRAAVLADSALKSYKAEAYGYLTFLAQMSEGLREPPKIVKTDQIASDLYWRAPDLSKQYIKGRRDTLLLPTEIHYHRDHLGIIQNNFPEIIRLGDGDEVEDVPHPFSSTGLDDYDFAIRDSLEIRLGAQTLHVYEIAIRPKDDQAPRAIGAIYLEQGSADVVRMTLSFTRAALKEKSLEDVTVVLENGLIEGQFWLPRQQSIEIRRRGRWLDYPVRGIIRGKWEISNYEINADFDVSFHGPEILAAPGSKVTPEGMVTSPSFSFGGTILDSLPEDVKVATDADVFRVQEEVRSLVRSQALARSREFALSAGGASDFFSVNRVEGVAIGAGVIQRLGHGLSAAARARYGFSDQRAKGTLRLEYLRGSGAGVSVTGYNTLHDMSLVAERSRLINSIAAQVFGSDYTDMYRSRGVSLALRGSTLGVVQPSLSFSLERHDSAGLHAKPFSGKYGNVLQVPKYREGRVTLGLDMPSIGFPAGVTGEANATISGIRGRLEDGSSDYASHLRVTLSSGVEKDFGRSSLQLRSYGGAIIGSGSIVPHRLISVGGTISAPGYGYHSLTGNAVWSQRVEYQFKVPFARISLGKFGKSPAEITLAPYGNAAWVNGAGWYPSIGMGALTVFDIFRFDVARGLRDGRWTFGFDVAKAFWGIL